eukprot:1857442-Lingulodinium_polyedra.AAC.1
MQRAKEDKSPRGGQEQGLEQGGGLTDVNLWLFAPRVRFFYVCKTKTGAWDHTRNCAGSCGYASNKNVASRPGSMEVHM